MDKEQELIYQLLHELILERREITKEYYILKRQLESLKNNSPKNDEFSKSNNPRDSPKKNSKFDIEAQKYFLSKDTKHSIPYDKISRTICSILKSSAVPLKTKDIYQLLVKELYSGLSYQNLASNILPRMAQDNTLNVEKAYRGYYQYRQK